MKNESFTEQFQKNAATVAQQQGKMLPQVLAAVQQAVQEMQDNGYSLSLQVRLRDSQAPDISAQDRKQIVANGTVCFGEDGPRLDFICTQPYSDTMYVKAYLGSQEIVQLYSYDSNIAQLKGGMLQTLMQVQAEHELVNKYSLEDRNASSAKLGKGVLPKPPKS